MTGTFDRRSAAFGLCAAAMAFGATAVQAQDAVESFYKGRQMEMLIGFSTGGGYDLSARLIAAHIKDHIPGRPTIVAKNQPGGSGRLVANSVYTVAPKDGTVLATADSSLPMQQAIEDPTVRFDVTKLSWIGSPKADNNTLVTWHTSGIRSVEDAKRREVFSGSTGPGQSSQYPIVMNAVLGTKFKVVTGYGGASEINLAMERGEVAGRAGNTWSGWKQARPDWITEKKIIPIVQMGLKKLPDLLDVPLLMDLATNEEDREVLKLLSSSSTVGIPIFSTPDVPADRLKALRAAFVATLKDPAYLADAAKSGFEVINPTPGDELQKIVADIVNAPEGARKRVKAIVLTP